MSGLPPTVNRFHPIVWTRLACITHPIGAGVIGIFGEGPAPLAFGLPIEPMGKWVVVVSAGLSLAGLVALIALRQTK
jgi:hypothetical protein